MCDPTAALSLVPYAISEGIRQSAKAKPRRRRVEPVAAPKVTEQVRKTFSRPNVDNLSISKLGLAQKGSQNTLLGQ